MKIKMIIMNKFIFSIFLLNLLFPQTGDDYLKEYPFDKLYHEMDLDEVGYKNFYEGYINGFLRGNEMTRNISYSFLSKDFNSKDYNLKVDVSSRTLGMEIKDYIGIIRQWCIANPNKIHLPFDQVLFLSFAVLPFRE